MDAFVVGLDTIINTCLFIAYLLIRLFKDILNQPTLLKIHSDI